MPSNNEIQSSRIIFAGSCAQVLDSQSNQAAADIDIASAICSDNFVALEFAANRMTNNNFAGRDSTSNAAGAPQNVRFSRAAIFGGRDVDVILDSPDGALPTTCIGEQTVGADAAAGGRWSLNQAIESSKNQTSARQGLRSKTNGTPKKNNANL